MVGYSEVRKYWNKMRVEKPNFVSLTVKIYLFSERSSGDEIFRGTKMRKNRSHLDNFLIAINRNTVRELRNLKLHQMYRISSSLASRSPTVFKTSL